MATPKETIREGSKILALYDYLQSAVPEWAAESHAVRTVQQVLDDGSDHTESLDATLSSPESNERTTTDEGDEEPSSHTVEADSTVDQEERPADKSTVWGGSMVYGLVNQSQQFVKSSRLYRWLTAEPDAEVIVIDLRETISIRSLLRQTERLIREAISVMPTSGGLRFGYQLRERFLAQPIRIISLAIVGLVLVGLLLLLGSGKEPGFSAFLLFGVLLLAARGTQETTSWAELTESQWFETIISVFEPPEPPTQN